jgi:DNA-binding NtrC family response regulator
MTDKDRLFLIVDDEPDMCWALEHLLKKEGYLSKRALNGEKAIRLVKRHRFKMAFLDAKLPDLDGLELAARIREKDPFVNIVMVSGYFYRDDRDVQQALAEGLISGFISKPFDHDEILKIIQGH